MKRMMVRVTLVITCAQDDKSKLCVLYGPDCIIAILHILYVPGPVRAGMSGLSLGFGAEIWASLVAPMV